MSPVPLTLMLLTVPIIPIRSLPLMMVVVSCPVLLYPIPLVQVLSLLGTPLVLLPVGPCLLCTCCPRCLSGARASEVSKLRMMLSSRSPFLMTPSVMRTVKQSVPNLIRTACHDTPILMSCSLKSCVPIVGTGLLSSGLTVLPVPRCEALCLTLS